MPGDVLEQKAPRVRTRTYSVVALFFAGLIGGILGIGGFTFSYAKGISYLTDDPAACANCHVMRDVYTAWSKGSHQAVAVCNDCHTPHDSVVTKYAVKAINGLNHSAAFTLGNFPEPIRITKFNSDVVKQSCLNCHADVTILINHKGNAESVECLHCHARVGHDK